MESTDNSAAPIIPAGTQPTVFGSKAFTMDGQALQGNPPMIGQAPPVPVVQQSVPAHAPDGTTYAELAAKKGFTTPDDLAKAYANLESHNKKVEMTAADVMREVYAAAPTVAPVPQPQPMTSDDAAIKIVQGIVRGEVKPLEEKIALQDLFLNNKDAPEYAVGIAKAVKENPGISWQNAYKIAKFDAQAQQVADQARQSAQQTQTLKTQVMAGNASPTQARGGPDVRSIINDRSVPFKEVTRVMQEYLATQQN